MKLSLLASSLATVAFLTAQTPVPTLVPAPTSIPASPQKAPPPPITPETIVATIDGKAYTAKQMDEYLKLVPPQGKAMLTQNPEAAVTQLFMLYSLSEDGKKRKLDEVSPYKEALESRTRQYLANIVVQDENTHIKASQSEQETYYEAHKDQYQSVKISAIYIGFTPNPKPGPDGKMPRTEAEAMVKAAELIKKLRAGADFAKLAVENSDDKESAKKNGEYATIRRADNYPAEIKDAIFKLKDAEISEPVKYGPGVYIFKVTERNSQAFAEVQESLFSKLRQEKFDSWIKGLQRNLSLKIENPEYFSGPKPAAAPAAVPAAAAPAAAAPITPETVVATISGKPYTAKEMDEILKLLPPQGKTAMKADPQTGLTQLFLIIQLSDEAKKRKLDQELVHKDSLDAMRREVLANAVVGEESKFIIVTPAEQETYYKGHLDQYESAKVSAILVAFAANPKPGPDGKTPRSEADAKIRAEELVAKIRAGADFAQVAKTDSDDKDSAAKGGDYATLRRADSYPEPMKQAVFGLKDGEISDPVRQPAGFYIFKTSARTTQPYAEVASSIAPKLKQEKFNQWFTGLQKQYRPKIEKPDYFKK